MSFSAWGNWEDFVSAVNRSGFAWKNLLGQEETGMWTPNLLFGGASTGITYAARVGRYAKLGRIIHAHCALTLTSKGTATGAAHVGGFPGKPPVQDDTPASAAIYWTAMTSSLVNLTALITPPLAALYGLTAGGVSLAAIDDGDFSDTTQLNFGITYVVTR